MNICFLPLSFHLLFFGILAVSLACSCSPAGANPAQTSQPVLSPSPPVPSYSYRVIDIYPHDPAAFTQGLVFADGFLYESTGRYGESSLRRVDLATGKVLQIRPLSPQYFGEGISVYQGLIVQLTWTSGTGFIYDRDSFNLERQFSYSSEGWGLTHNEKHFIMSDGTSTLHFLDFDTLKEVGSLEVTDSGAPVENLNELEYIDGCLYANVWQTDKIAVIEPSDGQVIGWINLSGLLDSVYRGPADVLNGIAYDGQGKRLFVTGKLWPYLFEIELVDV